MSTDAALIAALETNPVAGTKLGGPRQLAPPAAAVSARARALAVSARAGGLSVRARGMVRISAQEIVTY